MQILYPALLSAELFCIFFYKSLFTTNVVQLILETTGSESSEFLLMALRDSALIYTLLALVFMAGMIWLIIRILHHRRVPVIVQVAALAIIVLSCIRQSREYKRLYNTTHFSSSAVFEIPDSIPRIHSSLMRLGFGLSFNQAMTKSMSTLVKTVSATTVEGCDMTSPLIVLIIGESYNKHHAHLYEQDYLPTTPQLDSLRAQGRLIVFDDAVTPYNVTSAVFRRMFSTWDESFGDDKDLHTLFPAVFRRAGYKVCLVSNQFVENTTDAYDRFGGTIFNHSGLSKYQFSSRNTRVYNYDEELLQDLPSLDSLQSAPTLLIVHLMGQHVKYNCRYPEGTGFFTAEMEKTAFKGQAGKELAASYDNAVRYNDAVVGKILRGLDKSEAIALYLADHGEEVYDWRDQCERTSEMPTKEVARYQYEVPFMFYITDSYRAKHPDIVKAVMEAQGRPFYTPDIHNVLFHLSGIRHSDYVEKHDILSPQYDATRQRVIRDAVDYNTLMSGH